MLAESKFRRTAGFIRVNSSKAIETLTHPLQTSSDEFSSFQKANKNQQSDREFSPYRHHLQKTKNRPPLPQKPRADREKLKKNYTQNNFMESPRDSIKGKIVNRKSIKAERSSSKKQAVQQEFINIGQVCKEISRKHGSPQHRFAPEVEWSNSMEKAGSKSRREVEEKRYEQVGYEKNILRGVQNEFSFDEDLLRRDTQNRNTMNQRKEKSVKKGQPIRYNEVKEITYEFEQSSVQNQQEEDSQSYFFEGTFKKTEPKCPNIQNKNIQKKYLFQGQQMEKKQDDFVKIKHERARQRFISKNNIESPSSESQTSFQYQQERFNKEQANQEEQDHESESEQEEQEQELINEYPIDEFKKTSIRQCVQKVQENIPSKIEQEGLYRTKGGVCFDLDVNQFAAVGPPEKPRPSNQVPRKPKKVNKKEEILKRRQMAKNYDRQARARVFGAY